MSTATASSAPEAPRTGLRRITATQWILISMVIGIAIGYFFPESERAQHGGWAATDLKILSTIFLPITAIGGIYGMNFHHEMSPYNMPELDWWYGYPFALGLMALSVLCLLYYYRRKGWIKKVADDTQVGRARAASRAAR